MTIVLAARVAGSTTLTEIRDFGHALQQAVLQDPGMPRRRQAGHSHAPSISTPRQALKEVDAEELEDRLAEWALIQAPDDEPLALDSKVLSGPCWIVRKSCLAIRLISQTLATSHGPHCW